MPSVPPQLKPYAGKTPANASKPAVAPIVAANPSRAIDLVICLDVSGSMDGLLNAARQNLWAVVNEMATLQPAPELRVALLTYGCPAYGAESGFVAIQTGLTNDLDTVSQKLFALSTNGGDEFVARVVKRALDDLEWSKDPQALKLIFVAGNEAATQDPMLDAMAMSKAAIEREIIVNTIYCGEPGKPEAEGWRNVAKLADGKFASIEQDTAVVIETPFDKQLGELSLALNTTYMPYGQNRTVWAANQVAQDNNAGTLNVAAVAQRCQTKASGLYYNTAFDLVDACKQAEFKLADVKKEDLAEDLRALSVGDLQKRIDEMGKKRGELQKQVEALGKQRDAFVEAERKKLGEAGDKLFDKVMLDSVRAQAASRGFTRKVEPKPVVEVAPAAEKPAQEQVEEQVQEQVEKPIGTPAGGGHE
ncbi:MAG: vWA domain-containing protein [Planctomycetota bacterium]